jgi:hypothetical protein
MAVAVDEHKIVLLVILMIAIHMVDFHDVFLTKMEFAVAAFTMLLLEQSGSAWGEERIATQACSPVHPISIKGRSASEDFDVSNNLCGIVSK